MSCFKGRVLKRKGKTEKAIDYSCRLEHMRKTEYPQLRSSSVDMLHMPLKQLTYLDVTYLDHAGTTLYARSLVDQVSRDLSSNLFGNPHSQSPSSLLSTHRIDDARTSTLRFFNADPGHFDLIFVQNATAAIKLVAEGLAEHARQQERSLWYGYHATAHTSLVGVRELATGGSHCFIDDDEVERWISVRKSISAGHSEASTTKTINLFAYPGQSNLNGRRLPLSWSGHIRGEQEKGKEQETYVLLDASALVTTAQLDLSDHLKAPDYVALSTYKIFGYPDLGCLIVRKSCGKVLTQRRYFGGGTVDMVVNGQQRQDWHATKQDPLHEALEDGTPPFHSIVALSHAIGTHRNLYGSMACISSYTSQLVKTLFDGMTRIRYPNGTWLCQVYHDPRLSTYGDPMTQGPTIAFNIRRSDGSFIGKSYVEQLAISEGIHLRTGGVCNPGGIAAALELGPSELRENYEEGLRCGNGIDELNGKPTGIIRVSLGAMSNVKDVEKMLRFLEGFTRQEKPPSVSEKVVYSSVVELGTD